MSTRNIHVNTASYTLLVAGKKKKNRGRVGRPGIQQPD